MLSPIDKLEVEIWVACVKETPAKDKEILDCWQTDEYSHLRERFLISPMPLELNELARSALVQWQQIEKKICANLEISRDKLLSEFERARESYLNKNREWEMIIPGIQLALYGAVRNMDWVNLFTWILPVADKQHAGEYKAVGRMMTAIFYFEILSKQGDDSGSRDLQRIEERWQIVNHIG